MKLNTPVFRIALLFTAAQAFPQFAPTRVDAYKPTDEESRQMAAKLNELKSLLQPLLSKRGAEDPPAASVQPRRQRKSA